LLARRQGFFVILTSINARAWRSGLGAETTLPRGLSPDAAIPWKKRLFDSTQTLYGEGTIRIGRDYAMENKEDLKDELEKLKAENEALKRGAARGLTLKVSAKGGVSVYGPGRYPVTLYKEQWLKLLDLSGDIRAFIQANDSSLKTKN
jgi:hypothetical protein